MRRCTAGREQQYERFGLQAPRGERERVQRRMVQPLGVVDGDEQRAVLGQAGQQGQRGDPGQQRVGWDWLRGQRERAP